MGYSAGFNLTNGSNNICIGNSGLAADSGIIRIGTSGAHTDTYLAGVVHADDGLSVSKGTAATFVVEARPNNTGADNLFIGSGAGVNNKSGIKNVAIGSAALATNVGGNENTAIGFITLQVNASGINNTACGSGALSFNISGNSNTASGRGALFFNQTGNNNIGLGDSAGANLLLNNNIAIGNVGLAADSGIIRIGTGGTHTDTYLAGVIHAPGDIALAAAASHTIAIDNEASNNTSGQPLTVAAGNAFNGGSFARPGGNLVLQAGSSFGNFAGTNGGNVIINSGGNVNGTTGFAGDIIFQTGISTTTFNERMRITQGGRVGIGRTATTNILEVEGNASKTTATAWLANSDRRIKKDIRPVSGALAKIERVNPVTFRYTDAYRKAHPSVEDRDYYNVIAQEFQTVFPDAVKGSGEKLPDGSEILQVDTYPATITALAAIKELNAQAHAKEAEIAELKQRLAAQDARLARIEKLLEEGQPKAVRALAEKE